MPSVKVRALAAVVAGLVLALLAVVAAGDWKGDAKSRTAAGGSGAGVAAPVLAPVSGEPAGVIPTDAGVRAALAAPMASPALGGAAAVAVADATTGRLLYGSRPDHAATPASTTKITTAVAVLTAPGPGHRITTRVVEGAEPGTIVLVGGGDPTLTALDGSQYEGRYQPARLGDLAAATAASLKSAGVTKIRLLYDTTLYTGPAMHPIGRNENIAPVVALTADEGRVNPAITGKESPRVASPGIDAARKFATMLAAQGVTVRETVPGAAPQGAAARELAAVQSPPVSAMVEQMLTVSDNDLGEALLRQVALAKGRPASFEGGAAAAREVLEGLGVDMGASALHDGSGLDRTNKLTPDALVRILSTAASPEHPELRWALTGLPIAGFTGTLSDRYGETGSAAAAGVVRAKTGSLTGVSTLAGVVRDRDGRLLAFAILADRVPGDAGPARAAIDRMAAALADCGCGAA